MTWSIDVLDLGGSSISTGVAFQDARATWPLDGPGSAEVDLTPFDMGTHWQAGLRQLRMKDGAGTNRFGGYVEHVSRTGGPDQEKYRIAALGLASVLGRRVVHGDFTNTDTVATTVAWNLIAHAQGQTDGNHGFSSGAVTGTAPSVTRHFCDGDVITEQIEELAAREPGGFDWEIGPTGVFRAWVGGRGSSSGLTLAESDAINFDIENDTSDFISYATALGEADEPCGAPLEIRSSALASTYGRREDTVDSSSRDSGELITLADQELKVRGRARLSVKASWIDKVGYRPWAFGDVWLGDTVSVVLPAWFGGTQNMRVVTVDVSLEYKAFDPFVTYEFQAV